MKQLDNYLWEVCEMMSLCYHFHSEVGAIIRAERVAEHLAEEKKNKRMSFTCIHI